MIGKPEWFKYRTFGWGLAPKTWQGWVYVAILAFAVGFSVSVGIVSHLEPWIIAGMVGGIIALVMLDVMHIMIQLPKVHDERENLQQLIIERNCSFAAIGALAGVALFQATQRGFSSSMPFDYSLVIVLGAMLVTKAISTLYVKMRM